MPTNTISHKKLKFSLAAVLILLFTAVSFSFGTGYAKRIIFAEQSAVGGDPQQERSVSRNTIFASIFNIFYRTGSDDGLTPEAIITVNDNGDTPDFTPGNGVCADAAGKCTLRAAVMEANALTGVDTINFSFSDAAEAKTIQLDASLTPKELRITEAVKIVGPGARLLTVSGNPATTTADIFLIDATAASAATEISGLTIQKSGRHGINNAGRLELSDITVKESLKTGILNAARLTIHRGLIHNNSNGGIRLTNTSNAVNISNVTITGNSSEDNGGGINAANGDLTLNNVTISHNFATTNGTGLYYGGQGTGINVRNTIIANNTPNTKPDVFAVTGATFNSRGSNLIGKNSGANGFTNTQNGDKVGTIAAAVDPKLGPLQNNGGQTDTRALDPTSPAKDAGNICVQNLSCTQNTNPAKALNTDQRGVDMPRFFEGGVDMGAFETFYPLAAITSLSPANWGTGRGAFELTITGSNFVAGSQVKWNNQNRATTFVSNSQLKANILASDVTTAGTIPVTIVNPPPTPGQPETVPFTVANCTYTISPTSAPFPIQGGAGTFSITTYGGCQWTAQSDSPWIKFNNGNSTFSETGSVANVTYTVDPNTGSERTGTIKVGNQTLTISQPNACSFNLSETSYSFPSAGGANSVFLTASDPASCSWAVTKDQDWITVTPSFGTGTKTLNYSATPNNGAARSGTFTVGGRTFTINQAAGNCTYSIAPAEQTFTATGGSSSFTVTTAAHCQITPSTNQPSWITNIAVQGNKVNFTVQPNTGSTNRTGTITVSGQTFTVKQDAPCNYTINPENSPTYTNTSGNGSFSITTTAGCNWTATKDVDWITITNPNGSGNGTVNYTFTANPGTTPRTGKITVAGKTHTVTQSGCNFSLNQNNMTGIPAAGGSSFSVQLTTQDGCAWTAQASSEAPWLSVNSGSGSGSGSKTIFFSVQANTGPQRTGTITIAGITLTVTQVSGCQFSLTPQSAIVPKGQATHTVALAVNNPACSWTATTSTPWISVDSTTASGNGAQTIKYTVQANQGPERTGSITIAGINFEVKQESGCTFAISPTSQNFPSAGGNGNISLVVNTAGCAWTAVSNHPWITVTSTPNGTTSATVTYRVDQNTGAARTGTITIGGQTFTVTQEVGCSFTISPASATVPSAAANNLSFNITANNPACAWTATDNQDWISVNQGSGSGTGSKQIVYSVDANTGPARDGSIIIASSGQTWRFDITQQSGCIYNISPTEANLPREGGQGTFTLTTNDTRCGWTATVSSNATTWLSVSGSSSGTGNATITFNVLESFTTQRSGTISIGGKTFTVNQSNGCRFTLSVPSVEVGAPAGTGSFSVNSGAGCQWTATSNDTAWLTISNGASGSGTQTVTFNYLANPGPLRTGRITVTGVNGQQGGQVLTFTVNQANGCSFTLSSTSFTDVPAAGGSRTVTVTATHDQCTWSATVENAPWIAIANNGGSNRTGSGTLIFDVAENKGLARTGTLKIANQTVTVIQIDGCSYTLTPASMSIDEIGGERFFDVTVSNVQCSWTAVSDSGWLTVISGSSGTGPGRVRFNVVQNPTNDERTGKITVGGLIAANRRDFTIVQVSLTVRNLNDAGSGSLRQAVINANRSASNDVITFVPNLAGTILLTSGEIKIENTLGSGTLEIRGPGANVLTVSGGGNNSRIFFIDQATVTIRGLTLSGGNGVGEKSTGFQKAGGAVYVYGGSAKFSGVNITGNNIMGAEPGEGMLNNGGAIYFDKGDNHQIENSTISFNSSTFGGGITNIGDLGTTGLKIYNTTITDNKAMKEGGGIYNAGNATLRNVTIVNNEVANTSGTGAGLGVYSGVVEIGNTLIAENKGPDVSKDFSGVPVSIGNNLFGDSPEDVEKIGAFPYHPTDLKGVKPLVSMLSQFGGRIPTVALMSGSPAIDAGRNENAPPLFTTDQRGSQRVLGARIDIGAFEHNMTVTPVNQTLPGGVVNEFYVGQQIRGVRVNPGPFQEQYRHELIGDGELPPGMRMENGFITGTPEATGTYSFAVKVTGSEDEHEYGGANKFTIIVGCATSLSPQSQAVNPDGGQFLINITAPGCNWSATTTENWITIFAPSSGFGNGAVTIKVAANTGGARTGKIRIGNTEFTVNQAATSNCSYSIAPDSASFTSAGGSGNFSITTGVGCAWEASSNQGWINFPSNSASGTGSGTVSFAVGRNRGTTSRTATITVAGKTYTVNQSALAAFDFDGDGKADPAVFRTSNASWYLLKSKDGFEGLQFGATADKPVPADYDGDGRTDVAVFREGAWYYTNSSDGKFNGVNWGIPTDVPVPGDYDGDGRADLAVFRSGNWYILQTSNEQFRAVQFGVATDKPVPADYDGDGKTDIAVFREGAWYWLKSGENDAFTGMQFGIPGDKPVVADYDGDGKADPSVIRGAIWYFNKTKDGFSGMQFGVETDIPTPADFDGDGKTDVAVFREGAWYYTSSLDGKFNGINWGIPTDRPILNVFIP